MHARRWVSADLVITLGFAVLFGGAILQALDWPFRTALFPVVVGSIALTLAVLKLILDITGLGRPVAVKRSEARLIEEDAAEEAELEDVFAGSPRRTWLQALGWMALFFALLWALGIYVAVPFFALAYLLVASRDSLLVAGIYALASWVFIYAVFDQLLHLPLPNGVLLGLLGL